MIFGHHSMTRRWGQSCCCPIFNRTNRNMDQYGALSGALNAEDEEKKRPPFLLGDCFSAMTRRQTAPSSHCKCLNRKRKRASKHQRVTRENNGNTFDIEFSVCIALGILLGVLWQSLIPPF